MHAQRRDMPTDQAKQPQANMPVKQPDKLENHMALAARTQSRRPSAIDQRKTKSLGGTRLIVQLPVGLAEHPQ